MTILRSEVLKKIHCLAEKSIYNHTSHGPLKWGTKYEIRFTPSEATYLKGSHFHKKILFIEWSDPLTPY